MANVKPVPDGYPQVIPYLVVDGAAAAIDFYNKVLGTKERMRMGGPDGKVGHAELELGDSVIMLADEFPDMGPPGPKRLGGSPVTISLYLDDVDGVHKKAIAEGATELRPPTDQFYGDRTSQFEDPWGHRWNVGTHVEDVSPEEMEKRAKAASGG
ncbi:MAG: VOC family protein [Actinobacteria bacterium]|nr:MAG: VOC family protein [Actinomycetota bacterium]